MPSLASSLLALSAAVLGGVTLHAQTASVTKLDPVAAVEATVAAGHARFTVLTPQLIRMEWAGDNKFEDHPSLVFLNRRLPVPHFTQKRSHDGVTLDTGALRLVFRPSASDTSFTPQNLSVSFRLEGKETTWHPGMADTGNLQGTTRTLDGALGAKDLKEPIGAGLISRDGWVVVDDTGPLFDSANFDPQHTTTSTEPWVLARPAGQRQDMYFFGYGHDYKQALGDYVRVAGRIPLPPRYAFGTWWSRYWAYSDQELRDLVTGFQQNNVPLDVFVIDMDWHKTFGRTFPRDASGHAKGWSGYTWDPALFPDPKDFLKELHDNGLKLTLNLHPASGVQPWEDAYPAFAKAMGVDPSTQQYIPFDITDRKYASNYFDLLHHPLEKQGIDFWWLDWQQEGNTKMSGLNPTWWLNYLHFTDQEQEGKRPLLFHRWGGLGNHRYQIGFSGDTLSVWDSLAFQPYFTATAANVGYAYWSHDIGGHMPGAVDPELITRWIQFGAFSPILRTHTTKNPEAERRIWAYPEPYSDIMRATFQLRYRMQPYLYTEGRRTYDSGVAFLRPLYYDFPEAAESYDAKNEYLFGSELLVAPVVKPVDSANGLATEHVWLPKGDWVEQATGKHFTGPLSLDRSYAIDQIPVFVKSGAILPQQPAMSYTGQKPIDPLTFEIYPLADGQTSTYSVYEDSGRSEDYQNNVGTAWTKVTAHQSGDTLTVNIAPVEGDYPGMPQTRGFAIRLPADWPPTSVTANGTPLSFGLDSSKPAWHVEGNTLTTVIPVAPTSVHSASTITIQRAPGSLSKRAQLDGFTGRIARLRQAYDEIANDFPTVPASPDDLTIAMQTGDRIGYHPETAREEIGGLAARYAAAITSLENIKDPTSTKAPTAADNETLQKSHARIAHALADLHDGNAR